MDVPQAVRTARRRRGLGQRAFAAAAGVSRTTVADVEAGRRAPTVAVLERLLATGGLALSAQPSAQVPAANDDALRAYLHRTLTERLRLALGEAPQLRCRPSGTAWHELLLLSRLGSVVLRPPLAHRLWLPLGPPAPVRVFLHTPLREPPMVTEVDVRTREDERPAGLVRVALDRVCALWVPTPDVLADDDVSARLRRAAALLHAQAPRDEADRRRPPHRDPDDPADFLRIMHTKSVSNWTVADPQRTRAWRLGAAASLSQHVRRDDRLTA